MHYAQAKRLVGGHVIGRDEDIQPDEVVAIPESTTPRSFLRNRHFWDRGEHDSTPKPLSNPHDAVDTTVFSDKDVISASTVSPPPQANHEHLSDESGEVENYEFHEATSADEPPSMDDELTPTEEEAGVGLAHLSVTVLPRVGEKTATALAEVGVVHVTDLAGATPTEDGPVTQELVDKARAYLDEIESVDVSEDGAAGESSAE